MEIDRRFLIYRIDLNAVRGDQVTTRLHQSTDPIYAQLVPPEQGETVTVEDEEGDLYDATVELVDGTRLSLTLHWDSIRPRPAIEDMPEALSPNHPALRKAEALVMEQETVNFPET